MRKLATIETISAILPHNNADSLELAMVRGWQVVVRKEEFKVGDMVIFLEIDSWVPTEVAPFLSKGKEPRVFEGVRGERLRTVKLRGEISQGLILPISVIDHLKIETNQKVQCYSSLFDDEDGTIKAIVPLEQGADATELLGVLKWEAPIPAQLAGQVAGNFPSFIRKTDQERVQNCFYEMYELSASIEGGLDWIVEEKLDGSSCTVFINFARDVDEGLYEEGVCSRNFQIKVNDENQNNTFIKTITEAGYLENLASLGVSVAIQGEVCGPGIQGNKYKLEHPCFFVFDVFLIDQYRYATKAERWAVIERLIMAGVDVKQVPHLGTVKMPASVKECLEMAEGKSKVNPKQEREGIVFKSSQVIKGAVPSFKAISNRFLLDSKE